MVDAKRHHYLPEFYLQGFSRDGWVWVFDRPRAAFRHQRTSQVAVISRYYAVTTVHGEKQPVVEKLLSRIESETSPLIAKVDNGELLETDEKEVLSLFATSLYSRVPQFRRGYDDVSAELIRRMNAILLGTPDRVAARVDRMRRETGEDLDIDPAEMSEFATRAEYDVDFPPEHSIKMMLEMIPELARLFIRMNWMFCHPPVRSAFVTTDAPFLLLPPLHELPGPTGVGLITPGTTKVLPLSQSTCLLMGDRGTIMGHRSLSSEEARGVNLEVTIQAYELVVGRDEALLRNLVKKTRLQETSPRRRFVIQES